MASMIQTLGIDRLNRDEQRALALEILERLGESGFDQPLSAELHQTLTRRDAEMDANPEIGLTWEQIRSSFGQSR